MTELFSPRLRIEALRADHAAAVWDPPQDPAIYT